MGLLARSSGYETTVTEVRRPSRTGGFRPKDYQLIFTQDSKTPNEALSCPGNPPLQAWDVPFRIAGELLQSKEDRRPIDQLRNEFEADVIKSLTTVSDGYWAQWDGLAINTKMSAVETYTEVEEVVAGFHVIMTVTYRTPENNPYEVTG